MEEARKSKEERNKLGPVVVGVVEEEEVEEEVVGEQHMEEPSRDMVELHRDQGKELQGSQVQGR